MVNKDASAVYRVIDTSSANCAWFALEPTWLEGCEEGMGAVLPSAVRDVKYR
jgi:hypothetical protein